MKKAGYVFLLILLVCSRAATAQYYVNAIAGFDTCGYGGDGGPALLAALKSPTGICRDRAGNLYIADDEGYVRKIDMATGIITTIAGGGVDTVTRDNIPATSASIRDVYGLCIDTAGNLLITQTTPISRVRKVNMVTGIITTVAGTLTSGYSGDGGPATAAKMNRPVDVKVDSSNNIYIAESITGVIRRVDAITGIISTIAGTGGFVFGGDGGLAKSAELSYPEGLFIDKYANIYIADLGNNRIRKITAATGIINTIAGTGVAGYSGDGGPATAAEFQAILRVAADDTGNVYVTDQSSGRIRRIDAATGIINTIAGNGGIPTGLDTIGNGGPAASAQMEPYDLCLDTCGNIFFTDYGCAVRVITPTSVSYKEDCKSESSGSLAVAPVVAQQWQVYPNPATTSLTINSPMADAGRYEVVDMLGRTITQGALQTGVQTIDINSLIPGSYIINMYDDGIRTYNTVFVKQ